VLDQQIVSGSLSVLVSMKEDGCGGAAAVKRRRRDEFAVAVRS
jgi:hypothetical protein